MEYAKINSVTGWIVLIVRGNQVIQVHSNGLVTMGNDDRSEGAELLQLLSEDADNNRLHSQDSGGVKWE